MDELSYYCTIGSLVLLHVSFYWLHKQDRRSRDTAWAPDPRRYDKYRAARGTRAKVVLLVADEEHLELGQLARERLEARELVVYELQIAPGLQEIEVISPPSLGPSSEKKRESSQRRRTIRLNPELDEHLDVAIGLVESELSKGHLELYGHVGLVAAGRRPTNLLLHLARQPIKLLMAFSSILGSPNSRVVLVVAPTAFGRQATEANDNNKSHDYRSFECSFGEQPACGAKLSLIVVEDVLEQENRARPRWLSRAIGKIMRPVGSSPVGGGGGGGDGLEAAAIVDLVVNQIRDNGR